MHSLHARLWHILIRQHSFWIITILYKQFSDNKPTLIQDIGRVPQELSNSSSTQYLVCKQSNTRVKKEGIDRRRDCPTLLCRLRRPGIQWHQSSGSRFGNNQYFPRVRRIAVRIQYYQCKERASRKDFRNPYPSIIRSTKPQAFWQKRGRPTVKGPLRTQNCKVRAG